MPRIPRVVARVARYLWFWKVRFIQHILRAIYRNLPSAVDQTIRKAWSWIRHLTRPAWRTFQVLKFYIIPVISILIKIIRYFISVIERRLQLPTNDDNQLAVIANAEPRGLQNLGNTCYFNAVLQSLCHTHNLEELLRSSETSGELTESFRDFYKNMLSGKSGPFSPRALRKIFVRESSRFDNKGQHDSHECLRHFLDNVRKEEKRQLENTGSDSSSKNLVTVVDTVFGGHLMTVYVCMTCQSHYHLCEPCLDLSLPICFDRPSEGSRKQGLSKTWKDVQTTEEGYGLDKSKDETSEDSKLELSNEDETRKSKENGGENSDVENEDMGEEEEEGDDEEEEEEEEEEKVEWKREKNDQTDKKVITLEDHKDGNDEKMDVENERQRDKEEIVSDEEEKHVEEEKHETEKLVDDDNIRQTEEIKIKGSKRRKEGLRKPGAVKRPCSPTTMSRGSNDQDQHVECKTRPQQKLSPKFNSLKMKAGVEPEVRVRVKSQESSNVNQISGRSMNSLEDDEPSTETDPYRKTIRLIMQSLSSNLINQLRGTDRKVKSVEDCLMYFTRKEHLDKDYLCKDCNSKHFATGGTDVLMTSATKQTLIFNPPAILTLHLKRFELKQGGSVKRSDMITYGEHLDIAPFCSSMCLRNDPPCSNIWYSLYAVVVHSGSLDSGHYKAYVKVQGKEQMGVKRFLRTEHFDRDITKEELVQMTNNKQINSRAASVKDAAVWYCANDSIMTQVSLDEVLNQEAYLLFYERL